MQNSYFKAHIKICKGKCSAKDRLRGINTSDTPSGSEYTDYGRIYNFTEEFFNQSELKLNETIDVKFEESTNWSNIIQSKMNSGSFHIVHLNINSIFNKFEHVFSMLDNLKLDIIALSEAKLDDSVPDKLFKHDDYVLIRRDRNSHGGGLLIYVKKCY